MQAVSKVMVGVLLAGAALGAAVMFGIQEKPQPVQGERADIRAVTFDASADTDARLRALEQAVNDEREARRILEDELVALYAQLEQIPARASASEVRATEFSTVSTSTVASMAQAREAALVAAGMTPERAAQILRRESELQYEAMRAQYEARVDRRNGEVRRVNFRDPEEVLRGELNPGEYEQYLAASGRATSVAVDSVMASSPAAQAGLLAGDRIVSYDGQRVFNIMDLQRLAYKDSASGSVVLEVERNGGRMQVVVPRGPIGVQSMSR